MPRAPAQVAGRAVEVVSQLLQRLAGSLRLPAAHNRIRCMELILAVLRGLPGDVELDEESAKTAVKHLQEHLNDKDAKARELAVVALCKLVTIQVRHWFARAWCSVAHLAKISRCVQCCSCMLAPGCVGLYCSYLGRP